MGISSQLVLFPGSCAQSLIYWQMLSIIECLLVLLGGLLKFLSGAHAVKWRKV